MNYLFLIILSMITTSAYSQPRVSILQQGEECGRAPWGATEAADLIPNSVCAENLTCTRKTYREHDGWDGYACELPKSSQSLSPSLETYTPRTQADVAADQNISQIDSFFSVHGISKVACHSHSRRGAWVNAFKGTSYPIKVYTCGDSKVIIKFECKVTLANEGNFRDECAMYRAKIK